MAEFDLLVSAAFGMEAIVVRELEELGYPNARVDDGRVRFRGDPAAICRTNLWLRCAERVQVVVADFPARNFDDLFDHVKELPWEEWLPADAKFPVTARCVRSDIRSVPNTQKMVKRAIVERLRKVYSRHWFAETGVQYDIEAIILGDRALLTIDTTGDGLHKRGYRNLVGRAPLRETVAAALIKLSYWRRDRLLVDPFCGSGTIPIEAAMIGRNLAPGRNRSFSAETWEQIPRATWVAARQEVKDLESRQPLSIPIIATDRDRSAIKMATQHARQAGVETEIHFEVKDFIAFPTNRPAGILICNPPYGERLGDDSEIRRLYQDMGELLRPLDDWSLYILTGAEGFERDFGQTADRRRKLYNARIACTYYQYLGPRPAGIEQSAEEEPASRGDAAPKSSTPLSSQEAERESHKHIWTHSRKDRTDESSASQPQPTSAIGETSSVTPESFPEVTLPSPPPETPRPRPAAKNPWANARRPQVSDRPRQTGEPRQSSEPVAPERNAASLGSEPAQPTSAEPVSDGLIPDTDAPEISEPDVPGSTASAALESERPISSISPLDRDQSESKSAETNRPEQESVPRSSPPTESSSEKPPAKSHPWKKNPWHRG